MRSPLPVSSPAIAAGKGSTQPFLIPAYQRIHFSMLFVLATGFGWLLTWLLFHAIKDPIMLNYIAGQGVLAAFVGGFVSGTVVSATQWLVLRRYLPDWLWILASTAGYVLLMTTMEAWWGWVSWALNTLQTAQVLNGVSPETLALLSGALRVLVSAVCAIWLGVAQWLLLRQYTSSSQGWIAVPSLAVLLSSGLAAISALLPTFNIILPLETSVLGAGILGTTQAIALCALQTKSLASPGSVRQVDRDRPSPLLTAPEICFYGQVQTLAKQLRRQVSQTWTGKPKTNSPLNYLVGMTESGAIAAYRPVNQPALEQLVQTPLPSLVIPELSNRADGTPQPLARFNLSFLPSGRLQIQPWQGIPLWWLAMALCTVVIVLSAFTAHVATAIVGF